MPVYMILFIAVAADVVATLALARSDGFTRLWPSAITALGYAATFWLLSLTLRELPAGVVYAVWSGLGIVLISLAAWRLDGQALDMPAMLGLGLILAGVLVIQLGSASAA